jgi:hypothetical protein
MYNIDYIFINNIHIMYLKNIKINKCLYDVTQNTKNEIFYVQY